MASWWVPAGVLYILVVSSVEKSDLVLVATPASEGEDKWCNPSQKNKNFNDGIEEIQRFVV